MVLNSFVDSKETGLKQTIDYTFKKLRQEFYKHHKIEELDEDNHPFLLSLKDVVDSLPPSIHAIEVTRSENGDKKIGFLIKYDYSQLNSKSVEYCGLVTNELDKLTKFAMSKFNLSEQDVKFSVETVCSDFSPFHTWDPPKTWHLHFIVGDITKEPEIFYKEWERMIIFHREVPILSEKFRRNRFENYNEIYGLKPDPILSFEELIKPHPSTSLFNLDVEKLQKSIANLQLIPKVPDQIKTTIKRAKELFVFGYFRYDFFTISLHYAFLALEAAIKIRYIQSLGNKAVLSHRKNGSLKHEIINPTFYKIEEFCRKTKGWDVRELVVNGEVFPFTKKKRLNWLEKNHLIRKWEKGSYEAGLILRDHFSHPEKPSTLTPDSKMLHIVINEINYMFHKS